MTDRLLKLAEVKEIVGMGHTWLYEQIKAGAFPAPVKLSEKASRWRESEVNDWIAALDRAA